MPVDLEDWRTVVRQVVTTIADEGLQRRAWFGSGSEQSSPDDDFCAFFDDAAIEAFLARTDIGLDERQLQSGWHLVALMRELADQTPDLIDPNDMIDDPRWKNVRAAAARFAVLLDKAS